MSEGWIDEIVIEKQVLNYYNFMETINKIQSLSTFSKEAFVPKQVEPTRLAQVRIVGLNRCITRNPFKGLG